MDQLIKVFRLTGTFQAGVLELNSGRGPSRSRIGHPCWMDAMVGKLD